MFFFLYQCEMGNCRVCFPFINIYQVQLHTIHLSVGDEIRTALVQHGEVPHPGGQVLHQPRVGADGGRHVAVEDGLHQPRELHRVGRDDGARVALQQPGVGRQVPQPVRVHHDGDVPGPIRGEHGLHQWRLTWRGPAP